MLLQAHFKIKKEKKKKKRRKRKRKKGFSLRAKLDHLFIILHVEFIWRRIPKITQEGNIQAGIQPGRKRFRSEPSAEETAFGGTIARAGNRRAGPLAGREDVGKNKGVGGAIWARNARWEMSRNRSLAL